MNNQKVKTVRYYDQQATSYLASLDKDERVSWWKNEMKKFNEYLPKGKILEVGSGIGSDAEALIKLGYDYTGTDASSELLKIASKRNPSGRFFHKYVHEIGPSLGEFDGFWASAVLLHIPRNEMVNSLLALSSILKNQGIGFITLREGEGEVIHKNSGRLFTYYSKEEFSDVLESAGFSVLEVSRKYVEGNNWLIFYVRKEA